MRNYGKYLYRANGWIIGSNLGFITMKYKLGYLVSGVNIKKYDNDKVASIAGSHVMLYGLILIFLSGVNYISKFAIVI